MFTMRVDRSLRWRGADTHRYFPEWANRPAARGRLLESERNSYLAGGYAEEFGYHLQPGLPLPARALEGDPERIGLWRVQIGALHPGYPECPKPVEWTLTQLDGFTHRESSGSANPRSGASRTGDSLPAFTVIRVEGHRRDSGWLAGRLMYFWNVLRIRHRSLGDLF